jgi:hypothetical protein
MAYAAGGSAREGKSGFDRNCPINSTATESRNGTA